MHSLEKAWIVVKTSNILMLCPLQSLYNLKNQLL